ncbi:MAG: helix-turn-helix domain-containing protein [Boseongicola sp.]|nr:MAG: helix-turn-helix domain-containing protein [Boseongicola sp.]
MTPTSTINRDKTLTKGIMIAEYLVDVGAPKGVTEIARNLKLSKSNTFRILQTLVDMGYVKHDQSRLYSATARFWQIGCRWADSLDVRSQAASDMLLLSRSTDASVYLAVREGINVVYIDKLEGRIPVPSWNSVGGIAPIHCVAVGKALLAADFDNIRGMIVEPLPRYTTQTLTTLAELERDVFGTQKRGYARDRCEFREQTLSVAAAITDRQGNSIAAIGVSTPAKQFSNLTESEIGRLTVNAARSIAAKLTVNFVGNP